jgi:hypothetical protein
MKNVVLVNEENHGLVCVADSLRAAYVNLINRAWIEAGTQVCVNVDTSNGEYKEEWRSLEDIMGFKNPTKAQILDFVMTVDVHSFWDGCFYFDTVQPVATEQEVEWEVTILYAESGDVSVKVFENKDAAFHFAAKVIAFDDCTDERVDDIRCGDKHYHYTGWQPGMVMEFADEDGDFAWGRSFPEWDH